MSAPIAISAPKTVSIRLRLLLLFGIGLYFFVNVQRVAIPGAIFNPLQSELGLSAPAVTGLGSSFMYVYAIAQLVVGLLVSRYGGRRVMALGAAVFCIGSVLFVISHSLGMLYLSRALTGLGASSIYLSLEQESYRTYRRHYSVLLSFIIMTGYVGAVAANAPLVALIEQSNFRTVLAGVAGVSVVLYLGYLLVMPSFATQPVRKDAVLHPKQFATVVRHRRNFMLYLFGGINFGLYYVLQSIIGKKFLEDYAGFGSTSAAWILSIMGVISAFAGLSLGLLGGWSQTRRVSFCRMAGIMGATVFGAAAVLIYLDARGPIFAWLFALLSLTSSMSSIMLPLLRETNPDETADVAVGVMNFSIFLAVALFGNLIGWLMNHFPPTPMGDVLVYGRTSYLAVFTALGMLSVLSGICAFGLRSGSSSRLSTPPG